MEERKYRCERSKVASAFSVDDMTIVRTTGDMDESVRRVIEVMNKWKERNNDDKEERPEFGTQESEDIRVLGSWIRPNAGARNRIKEA